MPRRELWVGFAVTVAALWFQGPPPTRAGDQQIRVAAASDLKFALPEIIAAWKATHPAVDIEPTFGSSGNFYAQLTQQAPFDVFLSADAQYPAKLVAQNLAVGESMVVYAIGQLAIWVPEDSPLDPQAAHEQVLVDPRVRKVALANPRHAPYGRAAEAALKHWQLYDQVAPRLVRGDNVAQALQFVSTGNADVGLIALSLARAPELTRRGKYWIVPQEAFPVLEQAGVVLNGAQEPTLAREFLHFLAEPAARGILERFGFRFP